MATKDKEPTPAVLARMWLCAASRISREQPGTEWDGHPLTLLPHPPCVFCGVPAAALLVIVREHREKGSK